MTRTIPESSQGATLPLLKTVFQSILEVFILCVAGWILARRNLLDKKTQKKLNILNINLFTPALLFSKVAFFLSPAKLKELWIVPLIFVVVTLTSWLVSWGLAKACRLKRTQRSFAIAASMFMNSNSLPIALMQSLVVTVHGLKWGKDDTRDGMLGRALTYLVLHSTLGMMLRWSYGVKLLAQADDEPEAAPPPPTPTVHAPSESSERSPLLSGAIHDRDYSSTTLRSQASGTSTGDVGDGTDTLTAADLFRKSMKQRSSTSVSAPVEVSAPAETVDSPLPFAMPPVRPPMVNKQSHFFYSFPNTPNMSHVSLPSTRVQSPPPVPPTAASRIRTMVSDRVASTKARTARFWKGFKTFMTPPLYSALASLIVACIPPLQHTLDVHMQPVKGAINMAGNCSIPITLVVLGGYFWRGDGSDDANQPAERLKTDLPQQHITAAPERAYTRGTRAQPNGATVQGSHSAEPTGLDVEADQRGTSRPVSDAATLVGASTSSTGASWEGLKRRFRPVKSSNHLDSDATRGEDGVDASIPQPVMTKKGEHKGEARTVLVAILSRMVITPMIILPIMALVMTQTTMRLFDDPVFVVATVLFVSSPPALTLAQITQAASGDAFERLISKTIFWSYCVVTPITTVIYVFLGMELAKL